MIIMHFQQCININKNTVETKMWKKKVEEIDIGGLIDEMFRVFRQWLGLISFLLPFPSITLSTKVWNAELAQGLRSD